MVAQTVPLDVSETQTFTPDSLKDQEAPAVFKFGTPSRRDRRAMDMFITEEGLQRHSDDDVRAEVLNAIDALWEGDNAVQYRQMMEDYWSASDDWIKDRDLHNAEQRDLPEAARVKFPDFAHADQDKIDALEKSIVKNWRPLRTMAAENHAFQKDQPRIVIAFALKSWAGIDVKLPEGAVQRENGYLTLDCVDAIEAALIAKYGEVIGRTAFMQLALSALNRMYLLPDTEKNLPSPPLSAPTQTHTSAASDLPNGPSPGSAPSSGTLDTLSTQEAMNSSECTEPATEEWLDTSGQTDAATSTSPTS